MQRGGYVYILTNQSNQVLYTGVTSDINERLFQHQNKVYSNSFTSRYNLNKLVFIKAFTSIEEAIDFEKYVKGKVRAFKISLIDQSNPLWKDLSKEVWDWD